MLMAQLVQPPTQTGPARLPNSHQRPARQDQNVEIKIEQQNNPELDPRQPGGASKQKPGDQTNENKIVIDALPYDQYRLAEILAPCRKISDITNKLKACAEQLSKQLIIDGYINTRILIQSQKEPYKLVVLPGRLVEIRVFGEDKALNENIAQQSTWVVIEKPSAPSPVTREPGANKPTQQAATEQPSTYQGRAGQNRTWQVRITQSTAVHGKTSKRAGRQARQAGRQPGKPADTLTDTYKRSLLIEFCY